MNAKTLQDLLGATGTISISAGSDSVRIPVVIVDAREVYGRTDVRVEPQMGSGATWVRLTSVTLDDTDLSRRINNPTPLDEL